jgi:hypothetical protein
MSRERLPSGWKAIILGIYAGIQRDLGPIAPPETTTRSELRSRLVELDLPEMMDRIRDLLSVKMPWAPWWVRILSTYAPDLRRQMIG